MSPHLSLYLLLAAMVLLWSGNYIVAKIVLRDVPPILVVALRTAIAGALMLPLYRHRLKKSGRRLRWRDLRILLLLGVVGMTMNQFFFVLGIGRTTVAHSAIIMATAPIWVLFLASALGMERITCSKIAGMGMAIAGVAVLQWFRSAESASAGPTLVGDILVLLCSVLFAFMTAFVKRWKPGETIAVTAVGYIGGAIALAPVLVWQTRSFDLRSITPPIWAGILYMSAISSVVCYLIYTYALDHIAASRVAATQYLQPFLATLMAVIILREQLTASVIAAGGLIFTGVFLTERFG